RHQVDPRDVLRILLAQACTHARAPVASLGAVALVAEPRHQRRPCPSDSLDAPARAARLAAEPVAGERRDDAVEAGVGERLKSVDELDDGPGPAVGEDERERLRERRAGVQEVHGHAVDLGPELADRLEPCLAAAPVVAVAPVPAQLLELAERNTLAGV